MLTCAGKRQVAQHAAPRPHARAAGLGALAPLQATPQTHAAPRARPSPPPHAAATPAAAGPSAGAVAAEPPPAAPATAPAAATPAAPPPPAKQQPKAGKQKQQQQQQQRALPEGISIRPFAGQLEAKQVARLRAEAYYADDRSRFAESFKRQFASQEAESLAARTARRGGRAPACDCLVALDSGAPCVVGCIDIRVPAAASGLPASGVPDNEPGGAYILNVVVDAPARRRGVGRALMRAAMARAVAVWGATRLFTHVEADNEVAVQLYRSCGFCEHSDTAAYEGASVLGRLVLLVAEVDKVDTSYPCGEPPGSGGAAAAARRGPATAA